MRVGFNPNKDKELRKSDFFHQIIMPVYIPNQEDYFRDSLKILQYSLESIFNTVNNQTFITVVNNGCCNDVVDYLNILHSLGKIHELIHTSAIGKLNAIFKGLSGHQFSLITITDADVLFLNSWQLATYKVFENFPRAGAVSPVPSSKMYGYHTENIIVSNFFSKNLQFTKVLNPDGMKAFATSVGNPEFYNEAHLSKYLTIESSNVKTVVGAGHFVCTYRAEVFNDRAINFSKYSLGGDSEGVFLDKSVLDKNLWRLSTEDNFAFHMGNVTEEWMKESNSIVINNHFDFNTINLVPVKISDSSFFDKLVGKFLAQKKIRKYFLRYKGLTSEEADNY